jgi:hypothetical protein
MKPTLRRHWPNEIPAARNAAGLRHPRRTIARVLALATLTLPGTTALAEDAAAAQPAPPLVAVHYQDVLADEPAVIDLFVPPPQVPWHQFTYSAGDCLAVQGVHEGPPPKVLIVRLEITHTGTCSTNVELLFGNGASTWPASATVVVNRLPELPRLAGLDPWFRSDRIHLPGSAHEDQPAVLLLMGLTNTLPEPLTLLGFGNDQGFAKVIGEVFRYDPATFFGRYEDLVRSGATLEPTELAPGEKASFALILDPQRHMSTGAGTVTARPVALLEAAGQRYTLEFPRISTAWGVELP